MPRALDDLGPNPFRQGRGQKPSKLAPATDLGDASVNEAAERGRSTHKPVKQLKQPKKSKPKSFVLPQRGLQSHKGSTDSDRHHHDKLPNSSNHFNGVLTAPRTLNKSRPSAFRYTPFPEYPMFMKGTAFREAKTSQRGDRGCHVDKPSENKSFVLPHWGLQSDRGSVDSNSQANNDEALLHRYKGDTTPFQDFAWKMPEAWDEQLFKPSPTPNDVSVKASEMERSGSLFHTDLKDLPLEARKVNREPPREEGPSPRSAKAGYYVQTGKNVEPQSSAGIVLYDLSHCAPRSQGPQPFLLTCLGKVPPEIRDMIWEYVLFESQAQGSSDVEPDAMKSQDHLATTSALVSRTPATMKSSSPPYRTRLAILLTCHKIYQEAHHMFYANNTFYFRSAPRLLAFLTNIRPSCREALRFLCLDGLIGQRTIYSEKRLNNLCRVANLSASRREELAGRTISQLLPEAEKAAKILSTCKNLNKISVNLRANQEDYATEFLKTLVRCEGIVVDFLDDTNWLVKPANFKEQQEWQQTMFDWRWEGDFQSRNRVVRITMAKEVMVESSLGRVWASSDESGSEESEESD